MPNLKDGLSRLDLLEGQLVLRRDDGRLSDTAGQLIMEFDLTNDDPPSFSAERSPTFEELFDKATDLEKQRDFDAARIAYQEILTHFQQDESVYFNLGNVLRELGHHDEAAKQYRQAVALDPCYSEAWNNLGDVLAEQGEDDEAIVAWKRAIDSNPGCTEAMFNLADALESQHRRAEAQRYWQMYLTCDQESAWADYARNCLMARV